MRWSCALLDGDAVEWHGHSEVMPAYYRDGKVCLVDDFGPELRMLRTDRVGVAELRTYEAVFYKENAVCASDGRKVSFYLER